MPQGLRNQSHRRAQGLADTQPLHARQPGSSAAMPGAGFGGVGKPPDSPAELHSHKIGRGEHALTRRGLAGCQVASWLRRAAGGTFQSLPGDTSATRWNGEVFLKMGRRVDGPPAAAAGAPACLAAPALALALPDPLGPVAPVGWLKHYDCSNARKLGSGPGRGRGVGQPPVVQSPPLTSLRTLSNSKVISQRFSRRSRRMWSTRAGDGVPRASPRARARAARRWGACRAGCVAGRPARGRGSGRRAARADRRAGRRAPRGTASAR